MKFELEENPTEIKECIQQVREQIFCDNKGVYKIPQDLQIIGYPEEVINSFLDFIGQFGEHQSGILKNIKEGLLTVECREEGEEEKRKKSDFRPNNVDETNPFFNPDSTDM